LKVTAYHDGKASLAVTWLQALETLRHFSDTGADFQLDEANMMDPFKNLQRANAELAGGTQPVVKGDAVSDLIELRLSGAFLDR
jgi:hypothetical protein